MTGASRDAGRLARTSLWVLGAMVLLGAMVMNPGLAWGGSAGSPTVVRSMGAIEPVAPSTGLNVTVHANATNGTAPLTVALWANVTGTGGPFAYFWQFGDGHNSGNYSTDNRVVYTYTGAGTFGVEVNVSNASGVIVDHAGGPTIVVHPAVPDPIKVWLQVSTSGGPVPLNFGVTASPSGCTPECNVTVFLGQQFPYSETPVGADPGPNIPNGQNYTVRGSITSAGAWTVTAIATQPGGVTNYSDWQIEATPANGPFSVSISAIPASGPAPLDVGFGANITGGYAPFDAEWDFGDGGNGTGLLVHHTFLTPGTYTVGLYVTDANGTPADATTTILVTTGGGVQPPLTATILASPSDGAAPLTVHLLVGASGGAPPYSLTVCSEKGNCSYTQTTWDGATENLTVVYAAPGNFTATATVADSGDVNQSVASTLVSVVAYSPLSVSANDSVRAGTSPLEVELEASLHGGIAPFTIQWAFGDGTFGSSFAGSTITHLYAIPGRYVPTVTVRDVTGHEIVESLAAVVVPGSTGGTSGPGTLGGPLTVGALVALGVVGGGGAVFAAGRWRDRREGEQLVRALRSEDPPP
jgi:PKD repeat protein